MNRSNKLDVYEFLIDYVNYKKDKQIEYRSKREDKVYMQNINKDSIDKEYIKNLYTKIVKFFSKYVDEVILEYEYEGSPKNIKYIDRETLNQMIDRVLYKASEFDEIDEIVLNNFDYGDFTQKILLRAVIELLLINELFIFDEDDITTEEVDDNANLSIELIDKSEIDMGNEDMDFGIKVIERIEERIQDEKELKYNIEEVAQENVSYFGDFL